MTFLQVTNSEISPHSSTSNHIIQTSETIIENSIQFEMKNNVCNNTVENQIENLKIDENIELSNDIIELSNENKTYNRNNKLSKKSKRKNRSVSYSMTYSVPKLSKMHANIQTCNDLKKINKQEKSDHNSIIESGKSFIRPDNLKNQQSFSNCDKEFKLNFDQIINNFSSPRSQSQRAFKKKKGIYDNISPKVDASWRSSSQPNSAKKILANKKSTPEFVKDGSTHKKSNHFISRKNILSQSVPKFIVKDSNSTRLSILNPFSNLSTSKDSNEINHPPMLIKYTTSNLIGNTENSQFFDSNPKIDQDYNSEVEELKSSNNKYQEEILELKQKLEQFKSNQQCHEQHLQLLREENNNLQKNFDILKKFYEELLFSNKKMFLDINNTIS